MDFIFDYTVIFYKKKLSFIYLSAFGRFLEIFIFAIKYSGRVGISAKGIKLFTGPKCSLGYALRAFMIMHVIRLRYTKQVRSSQLGPAFAMKVDIVRIPPNKFKKITVDMPYSHISHWVRAADYGLKETPQRTHFDDLHCLAFSTVDSR